MGALHFVPSLRRCPSLLLTALVVFASAPVVIGDHAHSHPPILVEGRGEGPGWVYLEIVAGSPAPMSFTFWADDVQAPAAWGFIDYSYFVAAQTEKSWIHASAGGEGVSASMVPPLIVPPRPISMATNAGLFVGEYKALVWIAGTTSGWGFEMRAAPDSRIRELKTGNSSFFLTGKDFDSVAHVEAYVAAPGARAALGAFLDRTFDGVWAGAYMVKSMAQFAGAPEPATWLNWTAPSGDSATCPCWWSPLHPDTFRRGPSGGNRFSFTSITAGPASNDEIYLTGVDFGNYWSPTWR